MDDIKSEASAGFLTRTRRNYQRQRVDWNLRNLNILFEVSLVAALVALFASGSVYLPMNRTKPLAFGPIVPRKPVILGNTAGFGPDIVYNDHEMLWNKTRMKQIHRNWQQLFPKGRDYVKVKPDDTEFQNIHPPFKMDSVLEPGDHYKGYILASILATSMGTSREEWLALDEKKVEHQSHYVEYLRQRRDGLVDTEHRLGPDTLVHYDALTDMANDRAIWYLSDKLLPETYDPLAVMDTGTAAERSPM
ncbi:hypothetical protein B0T24DRAFT_678531 [Lasiosphaeria ovina]|uniref:Uncharacterized protein n=1 Tax=Lasiosphaeria ovina TaxID=92902 RepID=A0AAE0N876_9PEZI|nr:hypothetical protein B0T24DRAFT_678531 [Lasiosphaeria ovina]